VIWEDMGRIRRKKKGQGGGDRKWEESPQEGVKGEESSRIRARGSTIERIGSKRQGKGGKGMVGSEGVV